MATEEQLREAVITALSETQDPLSILQIEQKLRSKQVGFRRDDLRSIVWRLAAAHQVNITPESRILLTKKPTQVS